MKQFRVCSRCKQEKLFSRFLTVNDVMFSDGRLNICTDCINDMIKSCDGNWQFVDRLCQWMGLPFDPERWEQAVETFEDEAFEVYHRMYKDGKIDYVNWKEAYNNFKELEKAGMLEENLEKFSKAKLRALQEKWGREYSDSDQLYYLEHLYNNVMADYAISGSTALDAIKKYCKINLLLEEKIRAGEDVDKTIRSLDALRKMAGIETKNIKDAADFNSFGEVYAYLEKTDWINKFYDNVERDVVDKTMHIIQKWSRDFYVNESSIPEDIASRIEALKYADSMADEMNKVEDDGLDDTEGFGEEGEFDEEAGL